MNVEIRVSGQIDQHWSSWFEDLELSHDREQDETLLRGEIADQAALYGLLAKLRDLGLDLLSVQADQAELDDLDHKGIEPGREPPGLPPDPGPG